MGMPYAYFHDARAILDIMVLAKHVPPAMRALGLLRQGLHQPIHVSTVLQDLGPRCLEQLAAYIAQQVRGQLLMVHLQLLLVVHAMQATGPLWRGQQLNLSVIAAMQDYGLLPVHSFVMLVMRVHGLQKKAPRHN